MKKLIILLLILTVSTVYSQVSVKAVDFLKREGLEYNGAGPVLVKADPDRNRIITANTLSSAVSVIDGETDKVTNIPVGGRAYQHLKSEALHIDKMSGKVYLIGRKSFFIVDPDTKTAKTIPTEVQFESIAVDPNSENVFVCGRESRKMGFFDATAGKLKMIDWLDFQEPLINMNQTPPPPIRKVICINRMIAALDGYSGKLFLFNGSTGEVVRSRELPLNTGGRWHLAGYNNKKNFIYIIMETAKREVVQAARIDVTGDDDILIELPKLREGAGFEYNQKTDMVIINYDNAATVHLLDFENGGELHEIAIPSFGNDAAAIDEEKNILYIGSWARGEVNVVDLENMKFVKKIDDLGIIPHMFAMAYNPANGMLYYPKGASAVNGAFGAAVTKLDPEKEVTWKIRTAWAPIDITALPSSESVLVFNNEDKFAEVFPDGSLKSFRLPYDYPVQAVRGPEENIYLSYGPHQSYWPVVYIWGAKNGVLNIKKKDADFDDFEFYDRRIPRQAMNMTLDNNGILYLTQNNWGREEQFISKLVDPVRYLEIGDRIRLGDTVQRETTQRIMKYDGAPGLVYLVKTGEKYTDPGMLFVVDPDNDSVLTKVQCGINPTDLAFDDEFIYISNFDQNTVSIIKKKDPESVTEVPAGSGPLKLLEHEGDIFVMNHLDNSINKLGDDPAVYSLPVEGMPDGIFQWNDKLVITSHNEKALNILSFDPGSGEFNVLHRFEYPFGETRFDTDNSAFYMSGQFGDVIYALNDAVNDEKGRLWLTDFLSGKLFIIENK